MRFLPLVTLLNLENRLLLFHDSCINSLIAAQLLESNAFDVILMAETVYSEESIPHLCALIDRCIRPTTGKVYGFLTSQYMFCV